MVVIGFFSLSHSKLPPYIAPVIPMFALVLSDVFTRLPTQAVRTHFYQKRRLTLVNYRSELDFGLRHEPELAIDTIEEFVRVWRNETNAIALMPPALYAELLHQGLPMLLLTQQHELVAVSKP